MDEIPQPAAPKRKKKRRPPDPSKPRAPRSMGRLAVERWIDHRHEASPQFKPEECGLLPPYYREVELPAQPKDTADALRMLREQGAHSGEYRVIRVVVPSLTIETVQKPATVIRIGGAA